MACRSRYYTITSLQIFTRAFAAILPFDGSHFAAMPSFSPFDRHAAMPPRRADAVASRFALRAPRDAATPPDSRRRVSGASPCLRR